jgi:general secretion pathway protein J
VLLAAWREGDGTSLLPSPTWNTDGGEPAEGQRVRCAVWRGPSGPSPAADGSVRRPLGSADEDGFTLIELLVAIVLLGLLTTILLAGVSLATQHMARQGGRLDRASVVSVVQNFVRMRLANAIAIVPIDTRDGSVFFDGLGGSVSFVAAAPQSVPSEGLDVFTIARVKRQLVVRSAPFAGTSVGGEAELRETVLLDAVSAAKFRYYGIVPPEKRPAWHDAWRDMPDLPAIVSLELTFADGAQMPLLLVRPRLAPTRYLK